MGLTESKISDVPSLLYHDSLIDLFGDVKNEMGEDLINDQEKYDVIEKIEGNDFNNDPKEFLLSMLKSNRTEMLSEYTIDELKDMELYKLDGYDIGYALKRHDNDIEEYNEIVSVFNNSGIKGIGDYLIKSAISNGGCYLDHYDGFLSQFYSKHGFEEYERYNFDPQYDPDGEFVKKYGEQDVIFRKHRDC